MSLATPPAPTTRRILACVSGMSPAIITETLFALVTQHDFIPDEVHVITTLKGRELIQKHLLHVETGHFHAFLREYLPGRTIRFDDDTIHLIGAGDGDARQDITTDEDNRAAANTLYRVLRQFKAVPGTYLHASVAGGRKSMSFYMGQAFSLIAESQDRLSHVLVSEPFETTRGFFYPTRAPHFLDGPKGERLDCAQARVQLADLSVIKLGSMLGELPEKARQDFDFAIRLAQATLEPPKVRMVWSTSQEEGRVEMLGETIKMAPQEFLVLGLHALARLHERELPAGAALRLEEEDEGLGEAFLYQFSGEEIDKPRKTFKPVHSKILAKLRPLVGSAAEWLTIEAKGEPPADCRFSRCELRLPADRLEMVGFDAKWWPLLRAALTSAG